MSVADLTKWYVHINKFGIAASRVVGSKDLCDPSLKYEVLVKFEEAVEASSNSVQQLKAEILRYADEGIELCFGAGCDERIATRFEKIIAKLSAI